MCAVCVPQYTALNNVCSGHYGFFFFQYGLNRVSSVGIATHYRLDDPGIASQWGRDFPHRPNPLWDSPSLLYNGYRVSPGGKAAGAWRWLPPQSSAEVKERVEIYLYSLFGPSWPVIFTFTCLLRTESFVCNADEFLSSRMFRFCKTKVQSRGSCPYPCLWMLRNDVTLVEFCSRRCVSNLAECMACNVAVPPTAGDDWLWYCQRQRVVLLRFNEETGV